MGQFKPMVKMMTTEPSIELKLKKGGHVAMPKMKSKDEPGYKKMAAGGSSMKCATGGEMQGNAPAKPTMANRRAAMKGLKQHAALPASKAHKGLKTGGVAMGQGGYKNGGSVIPVSASKKGAKGYEETMMHTAKPDRSPAKTGDVKMGNAGGYKKGGNVKKMALGGMTGMVKNAMNRVTAPKPGSGSSPRPSNLPPRGYGPNDAPPGVIDRFKDQIKNPRRGSGTNDAGPGRPLPFGGPKYDEYMPGGPKNPLKPRLSGSGYDEYMPGGPKNPLRVPTKKSGGAARYAKGGGVEGNVSSTPAGVTNTTTGGVRKGNAGGFKKGGAPKKFARGGSVNDSGKAEKMPQGYKKPPTPVSINQLSGTYKRGGKVRKYAEGGVSDKEQSDAYNRFYADEAAENKAEREAMLNALKNPLDAIKSLPERLRKGYEAVSKGLKGSGSVTTTEREVSRTVTPTKKRYGGAC
jgi:hypothetical protein